MRGDARKQAPRLLGAHNPAWCMPPAQQRRQEDVKNRALQQQACQHTHKPAQECKNTEQQPTQGGHSQRVTDALTAPLQAVHRAAWREHASRHQRQLQHHTRALPLQESIHPPTTAVLRNQARQLPPGLKECSGTVCANLPSRASSFTQDFHFLSSQQKTAPQHTIL